MEGKKLNCNRIDLFKYNNTALQRAFPYQSEEVGGNSHEADRDRGVGFWRRAKAEKCCTA
ncbi:hypothetical protein EYF80_005988 [Liparis tanakae]|uniref:Uncharacterized protein n=1 Tax=Liparis tanakae TaxID=230148 RepID=A0A4Z2J2U3_9TELE|nr:hypothetical protein EYF80_005988 [Liparis tanakae]